MRDDIFYKVYYFLPFMLPLISFKVSFVHNLMFDAQRSLEKSLRTCKKYTPLDAQKLFEKIQPFITSFKQQEKEISTTLSLITGYPWKTSEILVYVSGTVSNSYFDPLTLKYYDDFSLMLVIFIHELVHKNVPWELQEDLSDYEREAIVDTFTR